MDDKKKLEMKTLVVSRTTTVEQFVKSASRCVVIFVVDVCLGVVVVD